MCSTTATAEQVSPVAAVTAGSPGASPSRSILIGDERIDHGQASVCDLRRTGSLGAYHTRTDERRKRNHIRQHHQ